MESHLSKVTETLAFCREISHVCGISRKVALLEDLKSPLLTRLQDYSIEFEPYGLNASKNELLTKSLKVGLKLTENFQEVISDGVPYQKFTNLQKAAFSLAFI